MRYFYILIILYCAYTPLLAQSQEECKGFIEGYIQKMASCGFPKGKQHYFIHMTSSMIPRAKGVQDNKALSAKDIEIKFILGENKVFYESKYLNIYQDKKESFTIAHPQKLILWSPNVQANHENTEKMWRETFSQTQVEIVRSAKLVNCTEAIFNKLSLKKIILKTSAEVEKNFNISRLIYYYDPGSQKLFHQIIEYTPQYKLISQKITYHTLDLNYQGDVKSSARAYVLNQSNHLLKKYQSYAFEKQL